MEMIEVKFDVADRQVRIVAEIVRVTESCPTIIKHADAGNIVDYATAWVHLQRKGGIWLHGFAKRKEGMGDNALLLAAVRDAVEGDDPGELFRGLAGVTGDALKESASRLRENALRRTKEMFNPGNSRRIGCVL